MRWTTMVVAGFLIAQPAHLAAQTGPRLELGPPDLEIGGYEADPEALIGELGGVLLLPDGGLVVGDRIALHLKVFGPDGRFVRSVGRSGAGPGEYDYLLQMDWCGPGELWVEDANSRVHRYSESLELLDTEIVSRDAIGGGLGYRWDCHPNGLVMATGWGDPRSNFKPGYFAATAPVALLRGPEVIRDFGPRLSSERIGSVRDDGTPSGSGPHPLGHTTVVAVGSERVYLGAGRDYEIEVYDLEGTPLPPLRWDGPTLEYDPALVQRLEDEAVARAPEARRAGLRRWWADVPALQSVPAYDRIVVSDDDQVWVRQFVRPDDAGEAWVVFGADHRPIGRLTLPPRSTLWEVKGGRVVYSTLDEFDVPTIRVAPVRRLPDSSQARS